MPLSPAGQPENMDSQQLVSLVQKAVTAIMTRLHNLAQFEGGESKVNTLVAAANSLDNLCRMDPAWHPWLWETRQEEMMLHKGGEWEGWDKMQAKKRCFGLLLLRIWQTRPGVVKWKLLFTVTEAWGTLFVLIKVHWNSLLSGIKLKQRPCCHTASLNRARQYFLSYISGLIFFMKTQFLLHLIFIFITKRQGLCVLPVVLSSVWRGDNKYLCRYHYEPHSSFGSFFFFFVI